MPRKKKAKAPKMALAPKAKHPLHYAMYVFPEPRDMAAGRAVFMSRYGLDGVNADPASDFGAHTSKLINFYDTAPAGSLGFMLDFFGSMGHPSNFNPLYVKSVEPLRFVERWTGPEHEGISEFEFTWADAVEGGEAADNRSTQHQFEEPAEIALQLMWATETERVKAWAALNPLFKVPEQAALVRDLAFTTTMEAAPWSTFLDWPKVLWREWLASRPQYSATKRVPFMERSFDLERQALQLGIPMRPIPGGIQAPEDRFVGGAKFIVEPGGIGRWMTPWFNRAIKLAAELGHPFGPWSQGKTFYDIDHVLFQICMHAWFDMLRDPKLMDSMRDTWERLDSVFIDVQEWGATLDAEFVRLTGEKDNPVSPVFIGAGGILGRHAALFAVDWTFPHAWADAGAHDLAWHPLHLFVDNLNRLGYLLRTMEDEIKAVEDGQSAVIGALTLFPKLAKARSEEAELHAAWREEYCSVRKRAPNELLFLPFPEDEALCRKGAK